MSTIETAEQRFDGPWIQGRDAALPSWIRAGAIPEERPRYDSVVIRGNGVGAMTLAGRLARSRSFAGKVVVAAPKPVESRKLVNGCTLRDGPATAILRRTPTALKWIANWSDTWSGVAGAPARIAA